MAALPEDERALMIYICYAEQRGERHYGAYYAMQRPYAYYLHMPQSAYFSLRRCRHGVTLITRLLLRADCAASRCLLLARAQRMLLHAAAAAAARAAKECPAITPQFKDATNCLARRAYAAYWRFRRGAAAARLLAAAMMPR